MKFYYKTNTGLEWAKGYLFFTELSSPLCKKSGVHYICGSISRLYLVFIDLFCLSLYQYHTVLKTVLLLFSH